MTPTEVRQTSKPGQTVKIELASTPKARHSKIALNYLFRRSEEVAERWNEHNGEPRMRETMKIPRVHPEPPPRPQHAAPSIAGRSDVRDRQHRNVAHQRHRQRGQGRSASPSSRKGAERKPFVVGLSK